MEVLRILVVSFKIKGAQLRYKEFQVIPEYTSEIRVDSALLQVLNGFTLVSI
jgi:hypothetical protein